jgi:hypothetical protein
MTLATDLKKSPAVDDVDSTTTCEIQLFQFGARVDGEESYTWYTSVRMDAIYPKKKKGSYS